MSKPQFIRTKPASVWLIIAEMVAVMAVAAAAIYFGLSHFGLVS